MSARNRRLREAARERDREQSSDTDESAFDEGLRQAAERQSRSRDVRPGRGTEDRVVERDADPEPEPDRDTGGDDRPTPDRSPEPSPDPEPEPEPEPDDDRSIAERIGDLEPGEVLRAGGSGGRGEPDVEVVSRGENIRDVAEDRLLAATDLTRAELEGRQAFEEQQVEFELLGRLEAEVEEQVGQDVDIDPDDVRFTEEITETGGTRIGIELTERFVEQDLPDQVLGGRDRVSEPPFDPEPVGIDRDIIRREAREVGEFAGDLGEFLGFDPDPEFERDVEEIAFTAGLPLDLERTSLQASRAISEFFGEEVAPETGEFAVDLAEFAGFDPDEQLAEDVEDVANIPGLIAAGTAGLPAGAVGLGRAVTPGRLEARAERARELTFDVPTGEGITDFDGEVETREVTDSLAFGVPATVAQDVLIDPTRELIAEEGTRGAAIQLGGTLVATAGLFSATAAISPRLGTATRVAIQPGEEIIGRGGFAATRRVFNERAAQRAFPNQEPLFMSEEAALRGLRRITPSDPGIVAAIRARELPPTPLQRARIRALRGESPAPPSTRSELGTPEEELFEGIGGPRGRTELFEEPEAPERQPTGITEEQRRLAAEITEREAGTEGFVEIASPQEARLTQIRSPFELERTERIGAGLVPPVRVRRRTPDRTPAERGLFRDFRASELEARREQLRDFGDTETEFQDRIDQAEQTFLRTETELEAEAEAEAELGRIRLRTEPAFFTAEAEAVEPIQAFEFEPPRLDLEFEEEIEQELEAEFEPPRLERVERPPQETEIEPPPGEIEPPREVEFFDFDQEVEEERRELGFDPFGVRAIETTIRAIEDR